MKVRIRDGKDGATEFLRQRGAPISVATLRDLASKGKGPKYSIVNGRAVYSDEDLLAWLQSELSKPLVPRRQPATSQAVQS